MLRYILYTHVLFFISVKEYAQRIDENNFQLYTTAQGLTDNGIVGIEQDPTGFIWIATNHGLNRFDGSVFKQFLKSNQYNPIPDNAIYSIKLFGENLTVATDDGAQVISTNTLKQTNLTIPTSDALRYWSNACRYVHIDSRNNYGVSTKTGFYVFSADGNLIKRHDHYTEGDIGNAWMLFGNRMYLTPEGHMMQQNSEGLLVYDKEKEQIVDAATYFPAVKDLMRSLIVRRDLFFFISTYDLLIINFQNNSFDIVDVTSGNTKSFQACFSLKDELGWQTNPNPIHNSRWVLNSKKKGFYVLEVDTIKRNILCSPKKYFDQHSSTMVFSDNQNRLWVGTTRGVYMENLHPKIINSFPVTADPERNFSITSLFITSDKIFAGTNRKQVLVLDKKTKEIIRRVSYPLVKELSNEITLIQPVNRDTFWIASRSGLCWLNIRDFSHGEIDFDEDSPDVVTITFLFKDSRDNIWIQQSRINRIDYYDPRQKRFISLTGDDHPLFRTNMSTSIAEDKEGNIWLSGDAITRWNPKIQKFDTLINYLPTQKNRKKGYRIFNDSKKEIWVVLNDDGFAKIGTTAIHIRPENLTEQKNINASTNLVNDKIFVPTSNGVGYVDILSQKSIVFQQTDGLPLEPLSTFHFTTDETDQSTWFACKNYICKIPGSIDNYTRAPLLKVSEASILNKTVLNYPEKFIQLKHDENDIRLSFSAINFTDPGNMRFAYRMKNKRDTSWVQAGNQPNILLTNISPGNYKVEIKVYAFDNKWEEQVKELEIVIKPPFWQTSLFLIGAGLLIAGSIYYLYRYRINQIRQKANLDKLLAQTEMKALHSQMNPHFIFNCLNSIREMILNNENEQASLYLSKFARLIRITLNQSSKSFVSLKETIDYLQRYIEMEQIRITHFTYSIDIGKDLHPEEMMVPPMLIQPFIENAIWHGASPKKTMQINISFQKKGNELICTVEDNGIGIEESLKNKENGHHEQSVGISNIRHRIELLNEKYNLQSTVRIEDKSGLAIKNGTGTIVTLHLPIKPNELSQWNI